LAIWRFGDLARGFGIWDLDFGIFFNAPGIFSKKADKQIKTL
jgi:hypothetical protein